jgi:hypothetical protein
VGWKKSGRRRVKIDFDDEDEQPLENARKAGAKRLKKTAR